MLHYRHNNFYAPVTPSSRDRRQRKQIINKEKDTTAIMLYSLKKETVHERQKRKSQIKKPMRWYPPPVLQPTPWSQSTTRWLSHAPIIYNNTMDKEFLIQMKQFNKCGRVRNEEIFNLHLAFGAGPRVRIPCLLQGNRHIYWFHPLKQVTRKKQRTQKKGSTPNKEQNQQNPGLREVDLEPSPKRCSEKINML